MEPSNAEAPFEVANQEITLEERAAQLKLEAREAAASSVRRIRNEGAARLARLKHDYARELASATDRARRTTRRFTSGFSIAFFVGVAALLASFAGVPPLAPDVALEGYREYEVAGLHVAVAGAEAESEIATESASVVVRDSAPRRAKPIARPVTRPRATAPVDPCTGDPHDPLNFCL